ncbi:6-bladed beta-propeller [Gemmatimonadota bacterium]
MNALRPILVRFVIAALLIASSEGCSSGADRADHEFRIYREGPITIAETTGGPRFEGEIFEYEPVTEIREDPDRAEPLLFNPTTIWIDESGLVFVSDYGNKRIVVFDQDGEYLRAFGRDGEGPGEFRAIRIHGVRNGVVTIWDWNMRRATFYGTDGSFIGLRPAARPARAEGIQVDPDGYSYHFYYTASETQLIQSNGYGVIVFDAAGDSICDIRTREVETVRQIPIGDIPFPVSIPFSARTSVTLTGPGEIIRSSGEEPILEFFDRSGILTRKVILDLPPERVIERERGAIRDSMWARQERATSDQIRELYQEMVEVMDIPGIKPYWTDALVDSNGYIWLEFSDSGYGLTADEGRRFRVLSPDGSTWVTQPSLSAEDTWPSAGLWASAGMRRAASVSRASSLSDRLWMD